MWIFIASKHQRWLEELHLIKGQHLPIKTKTSQREPAKYDKEILKAFFLVQSNMFPTTTTLTSCHFTLDRIPLLYNLLSFLHPHFTALDFILAKSTKTWRRYRCSRKCEWKGSALASNPQILIVAKVKIEMDNRIIFRYRKMYQCRDTNVETMMVTKKTIEMDFSRINWLMNRWMLVC